MQKEKIIALLDRCEHSEEFASYIISLQTQKKKDGTLANPFILQKKEEEMADLFKRVAQDGLVFDGKHISLQSTGISYDYVAYKNKMLLAYPESKVDVALVYNGDTFNVAKESGSVIYSHNIANPFERNEKDIIGGYCVIRNKRGEFLTLLNKADIEKHRKTSKGDFIWQQWFAEMALKTVIKKAVKQHFADIYENIENIDNENYTLDNPQELDIKWKSEIDSIENIEALRIYYAKNSGLGKDFDAYITARAEQLKSK